MRSGSKRVAAQVSEIDWLQGAGQGGRANGGGKQQFIQPTSSRVRYRLAYPCPRCPSTLRSRDRCAAYLPSPQATLIYILITIPWGSYVMDVTIDNNLSPYFHLHVNEVVYGELAHVVN